MAITQIQTLAQRQAIIRRRLMENNPSEFSTAPGSVIGNLYIAPLAVGDVQQQARTYMVAVGESIQNILALEKDQPTLQLLAQALNTTIVDVQAQLSALLDSWGGNFVEVRLPPTKASGTVVFGRVDPPTQDLTIGVGKIVESSGGIRYTTTSPVTMIAASAGTYFDQNLLLYVISVPVEAVNTGKSGNAPSGSITKISSPVNGLPFITNTEPISGGDDLESDDQFGTRLLLKWQAYGRLTPAGVNFYARKLVPGIQDVYVAVTGDPLSLRGEGHTDVWFKGESITQNTETFGAYNHPTIPNAIVPSKKPVTALVSVATGAAVLRRSLNDGITGSVQELDYFQFVTPPTFPVQVSYDYDARVAELQNLYNDPQYAPLNQIDPTTAATAVSTPILAKRAFQLDYDYTVAIMVTPGFNPATVRNNVSVALAIFADTFGLGSTVYLDDLNKVVESVPGVLRISGEPIKFAPTGQAGVRPFIPTVLNQYPRLLNTNIF
jgi:hypothetical protein